MRCSIPVGMTVKSSGELKYLRCGKDASVKCVDSDWCVCDDHTAYANTKGWKLEPITEENYDENKTSGCGEFCYVEQRKR
jgi:hypothetical protein